MFIAELDLPDFAKYNLKSLRTGIMAGAPCPIDTMRKVQSLMNMTEICVCYGMTETSPVSTESCTDDIKMTYEQPGGKERYWEQVPLVFCKKHYKVEVRECQENDIIEIDTFRELKAIDKTYDV